MNSTTLLARFRADVRDEATPPLWTDGEIFSYMDDAQKMFCREQGGIADSTSAVTQISAVAAQPFATISPLILKIRAANRAADYRDLEILNYEDMQTQRLQTDYGTQIGPTIDNTSGDIRAIVVGMEANKIRFVRIPEANQTIALVVYRMPLLTLNAIDQALEIDEHHHIHLLLWMKHLAHMKQDAETYDRGRSDQFRTDFMAYCERARQEREKREHKFRTVAYGGI